MSTALHASHRVHSSARCLVSARNATPVQGLNPTIWHSREEALRARAEERRGQAGAIFAVHGTLKHEYLASVLGVSRQRVAKCLNESGFTPEQMSKLGVAGAPVARAA